MGRIMAIDFGTKRTGLAVTDTSKIIATGLATVPTHEAIDFLKKYIAKEDLIFSQWVERQFCERVDLQLTEFMILMGRVGFEPTTR